MLSAWGPRLPRIRALATDGADLLLLLDAETDALRNPITRPRIARMNTEGVEEGTIDVEQPGEELVSDGETIYWRVNQDTGDWKSVLWSAPADGSAAPAPVLWTPGDMLSANLIMREGDLYFALTCRVDLPDDQVAGRAHIMRLRP